MFEIEVVREFAFLGREPLRVFCDSEPQCRVGEREASAGRPVFGSDDPHRRDRPHPGSDTY
jgi:hypothetical protein